MGLLHFIKSRLFAEASAQSPDHRLDTDSGIKREAPSLAGLQLPPAHRTKAELDLAGVPSASIHIDKPSAEALRAFAEQHHGFLLSVWTDFHFSDGSKVRAVFVGREAHCNGPYIKFDASSLVGLYHLQDLVTKLSEKFGVTPSSDFSNYPDGVSLILHLNREDFLSFVSNPDRRILNEVLALYRCPLLVGADKVDFVALHTNDMQTRRVFKNAAVGDLPYRVDLTMYPPRVYFNFPEATSNKLDEHSEPALASLT